MVRIVGDVSASPPDGTLLSSTLGSIFVGVNLGVHKNFRVNERVAVTFGVGVANIFNHPLLVPDLSNGGTVGSGALWTTPQLQPGERPGVTIGTNPSAGRVIYNPGFGQPIESYDQECESKTRNSSSSQSHLLSRRTEQLGWGRGTFRAWKNNVIVIPEHYL